MTRGRALVALAATTVLLSGCGGDTSLATWELAPGQQIDDNAVSFTALVSRMACNNGVTGTVESPRIRFTETSVVVSFTVSPGSASVASCPDNDLVPYVVQLDEPIGTRLLVDGLCEWSTYADTAPCSAGGIRRPA